MLHLNSFGQNSFEYSDTLNKKRRNFVIATEILGASSSLVLLNEIWYKNYPRVTFQTFNDNAEWLQMDKVGHAMTSYYMGLAGLETLKWSGANNKTALLFGGTLGWVYMSGVELLDGTSAQWGFSWGDMLANTSGTILLAGQELMWKEQRIKLKVSAHLSPYASLRPNLLGSTTPERLLKDYNGQTYWLSANLKSLLFAENEQFPKWLNVAFGYGAEQMISGTTDANFCINNPICVDYKRFRQFYFSLDADLTKVNWKRKLFKTIFGTFGWIKFPAPTIEFSKSGVDFNLFYF